MKKYLKIKNFICKLLSINGKTEKNMVPKRYLKNGHFGALLKIWPF